jgi:hypothetical protein
MVATHADAQPRELPAEADPDARDYFRDFLACATGQATEADLTTDHVIRAARLALTTQHAAEQNLTHVRL